LENSSALVSLNAELLNLIPYFSENSENMYHFTKLAVELNEEESGVAPTDSRLRRDQRVMEQGNFEKANTVKEGSSCVVELFLISV
jgi:hypothetical protein